MFATNSEQFRSRSCDVTRPKLAPKPVQRKSSFNSSVSEENKQDNGRKLVGKPEQKNGPGPEIRQKQANGQEQLNDQEQNGHCNGTGMHNIFSIILLYIPFMLINLNSSVCHIALMA